MAGVDVSAPRGQRPIKALQKALFLRAKSLTDGTKQYDCRTISLLSQLHQLNNPDSRILLELLPKGVFLNRYVTSRTGTRTADNACLLMRHWELSDFGLSWRFAQSTVGETCDWSGCENVIRWEDGNGLLHLYNSVGVASIQGSDAWNRPGILVSLIGALPVTLYTGALFDMNAGVVTPMQHSDLAATWSLLSSSDYAKLVRLIDQQLKLTTATLTKIPFDVERWEEVADEKYPNGLPEPYSDDPTQWIFHGDPCGSVIWDEEEKRTSRGPPRVDDTVLQVAVVRLLGYRWPTELDPEMRLAKEQRELVEYCAEFADFADVDGIVCLSPTRGEATAADRVRRLLAAAYDDEWSPATERALLAATSDRPPASLEDWLRDRFFQEHCKLFHNRPFIWHIWDGRKDGFHALVNYHRLAGPGGEGRRTLEAVTYSYLSDWIARQEQARREGVAGTDARLVAALELREQLEKILEGEPPYDIFVRWKSVGEQPVGWTPDINDGVRLNIRPFMRAELRSGGRKGAGLLRTKPNIKWPKNRGKEPQELRERKDFPWFWSCPGTGTAEQRTNYIAEPGTTFDGNRWNDLHYTLAAKRAAREVRGQETPDA